VATRDPKSQRLTRIGSLVGLCVLFTAAVGIFLASQLTLGCDEKTSAGVERVVIAGETYFLELADDPETRLQGLSGRTHIEPDGGMLFVFPRPAMQRFVMRDCPIDIDIIYLDASGRVVTTHAMTAEPPRGPGEGQPGDFNARYENRLTKYSSRYQAQFAIELAPGSLDHLALEAGDQVKLDVDRLKANAK